MTAVLNRIANESPLAAEIPGRYPDDLESFAVLLESTRLGRNRAVHEGAHARNVALHAVQVALVLEDAMQTPMNLARHFMVRSPMRAEPWEPIALVRQKMLANAFLLPAASR
ncbi:MAG: hypothetical protein L0271_06005 [Gemmatimonadetes bacterium]|nr:hypothetical protein [Gemmatimonadota bacterium]